MLPGEPSISETDPLAPVFLYTKNMIPANEPFLNDKAIEIVKKEAPTFDESDVRWTLDRLSRFVDFLINKGYNANDIRDLFMSMGYDGVDYSTLSAGKYRQYVVFDPNQIKSADLITYDDNGDIIPPSERFNTENKDIRYSVDTEIKVPKDDKVVMSKGQVYQQRANLQSEKVFYKKYIVDSLKSIEAVKVTAKEREAIATRLWQGYNQSCTPS